LLEAAEVRKQVLGSLRQLPMALKLCVLEFIGAFCDRQGRNLTKVLIGRFTEDPTRRYQLLYRSVWFNHNGVGPEVSKTVAFRLLLQQVVSLAIGERDHLPSVLLQADKNVLPKLKRVEACDNVASYNAFLASLCADQYDLCRSDDMDTVKFLDDYPNI
jgi:hypothetical protein